MSVFVCVSIEYLRVRDSVSAEGRDLPHGGCSPGQNYTSASHAFHGTRGCEPDGHGAIGGGVVVETIVCIVCLPNLFMWLMHHM